MNQDILKNRLSTLWNELYEEQHSHLLENFIDDLNNFKDYNAIKPIDEGWYKDAIVYSLYVDLFNGTFKGLIQKLDYLAEHAAEPSGSLFAATLIP